MKASATVCCIISINKRYEIREQRCKEKAAVPQRDDCLSFWEYFIVPA